MILDSAARDLILTFSSARRSKMTRGYLVLVMGPTVRVLMLLVSGVFKYLKRFSSENILLMCIYVRWVELWRAILSPVPAYVILHAATLALLHSQSM